MRTHAEWLTDCHEMIIRAFERCTEICGEPVILDDQNCEIPETYHELFNLDDELRFHDVDDALGYFAAAHAETSSELIDGKYASHHQAIYWPLREVVAGIQSTLAADPANWKGLSEILTHGSCTFGRYARVFADKPGLLQREVVHALNGAVASTRPASTGTMSEDPVEREAKGSTSSMDISDVLKVDLKQNCVWYDGVTYITKPKGALLIQRLKEAFPNRIAASKLCSKPSAVKKSLPPELQAILDSKKGAGYALKLPIMAVLLKTPQR